MTSKRIAIMFLCSFFVTCSTSALSDLDRMVCYIRNNRLKEQLIRIANYGVSGGLSCVINKKMYSHIDDQFGIGGVWASFVMTNVVLSAGGNELIINQLFPESNRNKVGNKRFINDGVAAAGGLLGSIIGKVMLQAPVTGGILGTCAGGFLADLAMDYMSSEKN